MGAERSFRRGDRHPRRALLDSLAERRSSDEGADFRSSQERYGDAFSDAVDLALNSPDLPMQAGERAHVMVAVSLADLKSGVGQATLGDTGTMTAAEARVHACDSMVIPAVLGEKSEPLNLGRLRRLISAGLRRALFLRDRGCAFPGCHARRGAVRVTTSVTGQRVVPRIWGTWSCCAPITTGCCTARAGKSASPPTAYRSSGHRSSSTTPKTQAQQRPPTVAVRGLTNRTGKGPRPSPAGHSPRPEFDSHRQTTADAPRRSRCGRQPPGCGWHS